MKKKLSWIYELPLLLAAVWAAGRLMFSGEAVEPSPLWLAPILFGLRYGIAAGIASGAAAAAVYGLETRLAGEAFRLRDLDFYSRPALFVVVGAALGFTADRWAHRVAGLQSSIAELQDKVRALMNRVDSQQKAMRAVEQQVVSQMSSVVTLYHGSRELGTLDRAALPAAVLQFFSTALNAERASLYVPRDGGWSVLDVRGGAEAPELKPGEGTIGRALSEKRLVTARETLASDAVIAVPVLDPSGEPAMIFAVHSMPFLSFNSAAVTLAGLLAEWGSESLAKCMEVERLKAGALLDDELGVHSAAYLQDRLSHDHRPVLLVSVTPDEAVPPSRRAALLKAVVRALREAGGLVARSHVDGADLAVLGADSAGVDGGRPVTELLARLELPAKVVVRRA